MLKPINLTRVFEANGVRLPDPDPSMTVERAVALISMAGRPELASCEVRGPERRGEEMVYTLHRAVGTKGAATSSAARGKRLSTQARKDLAAIDAVTCSALPAFAEAQIKALQVLAENEGTNGLVLPSHSTPWLG